MSGPIKIKSSGPAPRYIVIEQQIEDPSSPGQYIKIYLIYDKVLKKFRAGVFTDHDVAYDRCRVLNERYFKANPSL